MARVQNLFRAPKARPCDQMEAIRPGLQKALWGRRVCCAAF
jgi:hypothetical protein